jgi:hypothetical protein
MTSRGVSRWRTLRVVWVVVATAVCGLVCAGAASARTPPDPVATALRRGDVYVNPVFYTPAVAEQVRADAAELARRGEDVKLAAVPFVAGRNLAAYAEELRTRLGYKGTLVVTTPNGAVAASGPRTPLSISTALTAIGAGDVVDPAARLLIAAEVSTPPPTDSGSGVRDLIVLVGLALLGGALAIGWGLRREQRRAHARTMEARGLLKVYADALGARGDMLTARRSADAESRGLIEAVVAYHVAADAQVDHATTERDLAEGAASLRAGFGDAERAGELVGLDLPQRQPFADLCAVDPAHGAIVHPGGDGGLCAGCTDRLRAGHELIPRRVNYGGVPVSFLDAPVPYEVTTPPEVPVA